jgi:hypothetical protein
MFFALGIETNPTLKIAYLISAGWGEAVNMKSEGVVERLDESQPPC